MGYYPRLKDLREDKDLTQKQMGEILSCSQRVYSNYERGDIDIRKRPDRVDADHQLLQFHGSSVLFG